jgi:hypothetical protein
MFRRIIARKRNVVVLTAIAALAVAGAAFAYLSSSGSGSGTGSVSASSSNLVLSFSKPNFTALPQDQTVTITATNPGQSTEQFTGMSALTLTPADTSSCPAGSFTADAPSTTSQEITGGTSATVGTVLVHFNDLTSLQDSCLKGVSFSATSN